MDEEGEEEEEEEEEEEGVMALGLLVMVIVRLRLVESEEGAVAVYLVAAVCLVEEGENVTDLVGRDLVELFALIRLYPAKFAGGGEASTLAAVEVYLRGTRRVRVGGMLVAGRV